MMDRDEQPIGLHPKEVETLLTVFRTLIIHGATVVVIEHDLDIIIMEFKQLWNGYGISWQHLAPG